ncbi:hypothetical protein C8D87_112138 [Lentzea atacamensis]|uniref:Uncharacterized protein n=1 Tax=Lentzea atacamensis TaxID=531938 RepID=A0ABX9E0J8_9PSEU|nr:hypothetical protein C8D87_112138 [Lentzea atacamensis]
MTSPDQPCPTCGRGPASANTHNHVLLGLRTTLIIVTAFACAGVVGVLTYLVNYNVPAAILAGLGTLGAALVGLHVLIGQ